MFNLLRFFLLSSILLYIDGFKLPNINVLGGKISIRMSDVETIPPKTHQVFLGNLPFDIDEQEIGNIVSDKTGKTFETIRLSKDRKTGRSRGFCYIDYNDEEVAKAAVQALSGIELAGRELKVDISEPRPDRPKKTPQENSVFIGNLDFSVSEDQIMDMCNDLLGVGLATKVRLVTDRETGRPKGFGHIDFTSPEEATRAVSELAGVQLLGREVRVDHARRKEDGPVSFPDRRDQPDRERAPRERTPFKSGASKDHSIFLGNLAWGVTTELVEEMLTDVVGPNSFLKVRLAFDRDTGKLKGFGHVDFKDAEAAERALVELNGLEVLGRQLRVDMAQSKDSFGGPRKGGYNRE